MHFVVFPEYTKRSQDNEKKKLATKIDWYMYALPYSPSILLFTLRKDNLVSNY